MDTLIFQNQWAFINWGLLIDGVEEVNELVGMITKIKKCFLIFKVNLKRLAISIVGVSYISSWASSCLVINYMFGCVHVCSHGTLLFLLRDASLKRIIFKRCLSKETPWPYYFSCLWWKVLVASLVWWKIWFYS